MPLDISEKKMSNVVSIITSFAVGFATAFLLRGNFVGSLFARASAFSSSEGYKMALVARTDIGMSKGKAAAQCAHAAVGCYKRATRENPKLLKAWEYDGQPKVVLRPDTPGEETILQLAKTANNMGLITCVIRDAGHTQLESGTITVVGIGPGTVENINSVVGHLKLF